jgi:hypothetical protein
VFQFLIQKHHNPVLKHIKFGVDITSNPPGRSFFLRNNRTSLIGMANAPKPQGTSRNQNIRPALDLGFPRIFHQHAV